MKQSRNLLLNIHCHGGNKATRDLLDRVVSRLPTEVRKYVIQRVSFVTVGRSSGGLTKRVSGFRNAGRGKGAEWVVTLSEDGLADYIIAHEIAHAYEAHIGTRSERENRADVLAATWGFPRPKPAEDRA